MQSGQDWVTPHNRALIRELQALDPAAREYFEERAGILEFEGGMPRAAAEALALKQVTGAGGTSPRART